MLHGLTARPSAGASAVDDLDDRNEQTVRTALLQRQQSDIGSTNTPLLSPSPLPRVYLGTLSLLVLVGLLLCASLTSWAISGPTLASPSARSPLLPQPHTPIQSPYNEQQTQQRQPHGSDTAQPAAATAAQSVSTAESLGDSPVHSSSSSGSASVAQSPSSASSSLSPLSAAPTPVSNAAGVRYAVERRYGGYIARENYNIHSNHILTLANKPSHAGCKPTEPGAATYQCDIFNLTEALAECSTMTACVGVVCWKEHWEGCQLKGRPVLHDTNHRFVSLYKDAAAVEEAEAAWRQQEEVRRAKSQKGQLGSFNPAPCGAGSKCVVSMGLYGADERYTGNIVINARLLPSVLPGWLLRVYHDASVPASVLSSLRAEGAELLDMSRSSLQGGIAGMYWRFMVSEDELVDRWLIRDADCRVSPREAAAVRSWIESGYSVHIMRDHPNHGRRMMGGMWGGVKHAVRNITQRILAASSDVNSYNGDQEFLAYHVYPTVEFDQLSHDSWTCLSFTNSHPFPAAGRRQFDNSSFVGMIYGKDSSQQVNGDIRCCLINREATIACRERFDDRWG